MEDKRSTVALPDEEATALLTALDRGYFAIPRRGTRTGFADELGISDMEASARLRRAMTKTVTGHRELFDRPLGESQPPPPN